MEKILSCRDPGGINNNRPAIRELMEETVHRSDQNTLVMHRNFMAAEWHADGVDPHIDFYDRLWLSPSEGVSESVSNQFTRPVPADRRVGPGTFTPSRSQIRT